LESEHSNNNHMHTRTQSRMAMHSHDVGNDHFIMPSILWPNRCQ